MIVRRFGPDAASFQFVLQTQGVFNAALPGRPFIIYTDHTIASHHEYPYSDPRLFRSKKMLRLERTLYHTADRIVVTAAHVENTLIRAYDCDPARIATILIGANVQAAPSSDAPDRYAAGRILFVGIDWERKGGPTLLAAFDKIAQRYPQATLTIAGCSPTCRTHGSARWVYCPVSRSLRCLRTLPYFACQAWSSHRPWRPWRRWHSNCPSWQRR